jgi:hypothetical protein
VEDSGEAADWKGAGYCGCVVYGGTMDDRKCSVDGGGLNGAVVCSGRNSMSGVRSCITDLSVWGGKRPDKLEVSVQ